MPKRVEARSFFRPALEEQRYLPECPRVIGGSLVWLSIQYAADRPWGGINVLDLASRENVHHALPGRPGFFAEIGEAGEPGEPGVLLIGLERRLVLYDLNRGAVTETLAHIPEDPRVIINDGIAIPGGAIFGTKHLGFSQPVAALYHYDHATRQVRELLGGQTCSNGKYFHDGLLVDIDSQPKTITEYRYNGALHTLHALRLIAQPEALPALPDGLRPMPGGQSAIVAYYNPAQVADGIAQEIRLSDGEVLTEFVLPGSPRVTCPEVGELDGAPCVFFTTAIEGMTQETRAIAPEAGTIFVAGLAPFVGQLGKLRATQRVPRLPAQLADCQSAAGCQPAPHSGKPQTEHRAEFYGADGLRGGITRRRGGRMPPRMGAWQPGRLRYGAATKCPARMVAGREETNG